MSQLPIQIENFESTSKNFTLRYLLYEDKQLQIIQEGVNMYYWTPYNLFRFCIFFPVFLYILLENLIQLVSGSVNVSTHQGSILLSSSICFFVLLLVQFYFGFPFLKLFIFKSKEARFYSFRLLTNQPAAHILSSVTIKLDSYNISFPLDGERKKLSETLYQYYGYPYANKHLDKRFSLTLDRQLELVIGSKAVSFSLSLTDPKSVKPSQCPQNLCLFVKDLTVFEQGDQIDLKEKEAS